MDEKSSMLDGDEILPQPEEIKKKVRKPLSEETLGKLAKAREKASERRKEMAEERKVHKETLVQSKIEEQLQAQQIKDEKSANREAKKRVKAKRQSIIIERSSDSGSSSEDDIRDARVYTVRKSRNNVEGAAPTQARSPVEDPLSGMYNQFFLGTRTIL